MIRRLYKVEGEIAVITLSASLPSERVANIEITVDYCGDDMNVNQRLAMKLGPKLSTE